MNEQKPQHSFAQCREIMKSESENVPTGRLFEGSRSAEEKQLAAVNPAQLFQVSRDVAAVCGEIVRRQTIRIKGRRYIRVEGWQALATAHGCIASARDVEKVEGGFKAIGEIRRMSDGLLLGSAEGFVGSDEAVWFGGQDQGGRTWPRRPEYAIRAMAQTRAISRVCRSAFAHVVILIGSDLETCPAEEIEQTEDQKPLEYSEQELVNTELQSAAQRRREH